MIIGLYFIISHALNFIFISFPRHVSSAAGRENYFKKPLKRMREDTLFAPFLDDGERGHIFFFMLVCETAGR